MSEQTSPAGIIEPIGPGRLVLVVGPSGAGKDTVIGGARTACLNDATVIFPRRSVTRMSSDAEDHNAIAPAEFTRAVQDGAFSFWWDAHGLQYGIPRHVDNDIAAGHTVVCNVSRSVVTELRARYAHVTVVLVTAPAEVLAARLAGRSRASDGDLALRLQRNIAYAGFEADAVIENAGERQLAIRQFVALIKSAS